MKVLREITSRVLLTTLDGKSVKLMNVNDF